MKLSYTGTELKKVILFIVLLYINIGSKEIFRFFEANDFVPFGVAFFSLLSLTLLLNSSKEYTELFLYSVIFYLFLLTMSFGSNSLDYGLQKAFLGLLLPMTLFNFFSKREWTEEEIIDYLVIAVFIVSIIGILFKLREGFFDRSVRFGLLGPIPFGWLNGMAFLALVLQKHKKMNVVFLALFFFAMVIWTGSKGPLIGVVFMTLVFFNRIIGKEISSKFTVLVLIIITGFVLDAYSDDIRAVKNITDFIANPEEYSEGVGKGSIGTRADYFNISLNLFYQNPILGVGLGGWQENSLMDHKYPHNVFFELLSEIGILGLLFWVVLLLKLKYNSIFAYIGVFGLVALMFSGDFSYFRYAFYPLLIGYYLHIKTYKTIN